MFRRMGYPQIMRDGEAGGGATPWYQGVAGVDARPGLIHRSSARNRARRPESPGDPRGPVTRPGARLPSGARQTDSPGRDLDAPATLRRHSLRVSEVAVHLCPGRAGPGPGPGQSGARIFASDSESGLGLYH